MTSSEILDQVIISINSRVKAFDSVTKHCDVGLSTVGDLNLALSFPLKTEGQYGEEIKDYNVCKLRRHKEWQTREYRDEGCATYQLIRFLEEATHKASEIFWRVRPEIVSTIEFDSNYRKYVGRVRFSVF